LDVRQSPALNNDPLDLLEAVAAVVVGKANSFTIDREAVVLSADVLSHSMSCACGPSPNSAPYAF